MNLSISYEGLQLFIQDLKAQGILPAAILVSPHEKRDLKQELMSRSFEHSPDAEREDHDTIAIGVIEGIPILSGKDVPRGKAWIIPRSDPGDQNRFVAVT